MQRKDLSMYRKGCVMRQPFFTTDRELFWIIFCLWHIPILGTRMIIWLWMGVENVLRHSHKTIQKQSIKPKGSEYDKVFWSDNLLVWIYWFNFLSICFQEPPTQVGFPFCLKNKNPLANPSTCKGQFLLACTQSGGRTRTPFSIGVWDRLVYRFQHLGGKRLQR